MSRWLLVSSAALCLVALEVGSVSAQNTYPYGPPGYGPYYQTQLSPYLNFLRGGLPAANYYLGTIPEFQRRQNAKVFQSEISTALTVATTPQLGPDEAGLLRPLKSAGHPTAFGYTGNYFGGMAGIQGVRPMAARPNLSGGNTAGPGVMQRQGTPGGGQPPLNPFGGGGR